MRINGGRNSTLCWGKESVGTWITAEWACGIEGAPVCSGQLQLNKRLQLREMREGKTEIMLNPQMIALQSSLRKKDDGGAGTLLRTGKPGSFYSGCK